ncbi:hypothetical protein EK599_21030 [Vibrio sp. T187]|uniref:hypothetical protein n=1 Tax=Vibrio TaxID=662 RepID=UPI0010C9FD2E|nr:MULTISPECIES: hypothetical protein [Vibrio]MBW3698162.1 hypothetical protein [Vibrio sp. T187]
MLSSKGGYILGTEVVTPTGMNLDIATEVAQSDLGRFDQRVSDDGLERFTFASVEFTTQKETDEKLYEMLSYIIESLLEQLPRALKPIPLQITLPKGIDVVKVKDWVGESTYNDCISHVDIVQVGGPSTLLHALKAMERYDALLCVSADSLVSHLDKLIEERSVLSSSNPWGIIPSEGAAGIILCRKNLVDTLKLTPKAKLGYMEVDTGSTDRRGMYRLVQKASKVLDSFGEVYSDMTNLRAHTEDYGFALGARAERFINPQQPKLINELWGTMGNCSALALVGFAIRQHDLNQPISLLMFDQNKEKALLQLLAS